MSAEGTKALQEIYAAIFKEMQSAMGGADSDGKPTYRDIHHWLETQFHTSEAQADLVKDLQALEVDCRQVLNLPPSSYTTTVPCKTSLVQASSGPEQKLNSLKLRLWQLDFKLAGQVKAGASLHAVRDCMHKNLVGQGNETAKYPVQDLAFHFFTVLCLRLRQHVLTYYHADLGSVSLQQADP